jgi:hypothetical protein
MFRIFREHAAHQIADDRGQTVISQEGGMCPDFKLPANDGRIVHLRQWRLAKAKAEQQYAKRIDVIGDIAIAPARRHAHGGIGRLEKRRLGPSRRCCPRGAQHHRPTGTLLEHVVEADAPVGHAALLHLLQDLRRRPEHTFQKLGFRPGMRPRQQTSSLSDLTPRGHPY